MKKRMWLGMIAALVTLGLASGAHAQAPAALKNRVAAVKCPSSSSAACIRLDLVQAMASTSSGAGKSMSKSGAAMGASNAAKSALIHRSPLGGVENNPVSDGARAHVRAQGTQRSLDRPRASHSERRAPASIRSREVFRHRPSDF